MSSRHLSKRPKGSALILLIAALLVVVAVILLWPNILDNEGKDTSASARPDAAVKQANATVKQAKALADQAADDAQKNTREAVDAAENPVSENSGVQRPDVRDVLTRCLTCHAPNSALPNVPRIGNRDDWAPLLKKGKKTLTDNAYYGYVNPKGGVMPPKGGDAGLTYAEVEAAVVYLANQSGGHFE